MLDNLVESKNTNTENKRLSRFILMTFLTVTFLLMFGLIYSLFSQSLALGNGDFNVSSLVVPVVVTEEKEPPAEMKIESKQTERTNSQIISRVVNMQSVNESPRKTPDSVSIVRTESQARPDSPFVLGKLDSNPPQMVSTVGINNSNGNLKGLSKTIDPAETRQIIEMEKPPVIKEPVKPLAEKIKPPVSGGVVNSKAINLVKPVYSSAARVMRANGEVQVQVTIDENGKVISATAVSGHPLLRDSAEMAARSSKFTSTILSNQKVKVTGIIIYNFAIQ